MPDLTKMPDDLWQETSTPPAGASQQRRTAPAKPKPKKPKVIRDAVLQARMPEAELREFRADAAKVGQRVSEFVSTCYRAYLAQKKGGN
jgi:hypothetical protein